MLITILFQWAIGLLSSHIRKPAEWSHEWGYRFSLEQKESYLPAPIVYFACKRYEEFVQRDPHLLKLFYCERGDDLAKPYVLQQLSINPYVPHETAMELRPQLHNLQTLADVCNSPVHSVAGTFYPSGSDQHAVEHHGSQQNQPQHQSPQLDPNLLAFQHQLLTDPTTLHNFMQWGLQQQQAATALQQQQQQQQASHQVKNQNVLDLQQQQQQEISMEVSTSTHPPPQRTRAPPNQVEWPNKATPVSAQPEPFWVRKEVFRGLSPALQRKVAATCPAKQACVIHRTQTTTAILGVTSSPGGAAPSLCQP